MSPFDVIARVLVERFGGCEPTKELRAMVRARGIGWRRVVRHASDQYVLPAFAAALRDLDLIESLDAELGAFLEAVHAANAERNSELRQELAAAVGVLNRAQIEPVLLKGSIRLLDGLYPDDGWRMLRDLDLLVPTPQMAEAVEALKEAGYALCGSDNEMRRQEGTCQIDLHGELFSAPSQARLLPALDMLNGSSRVAFGDRAVRIPSVEQQLVHLVGHSQIRHYGQAFGRIHLRDRLEAAALVRWGHEGVDWQAVSARFAAAGYRRSLLSMLLALHDGAWCAVPATSSIDLVTALQRRRIALQARSATFAYIGARAGWCVSEFKRQIEKSESGQLRAVRNLKRLVFERGAVWQLGRALAGRHQQLLHGLLHLACFVAP